MVSSVGCPTTDLASPISAIKIGVGSFPATPSELSSPFSPFGSVPLSLSSVAITTLPEESVSGVPSGLTPSPPAVPWLFNPCDTLSMPSGSIVTVIMTSNEEPTSRLPPTIRLCVVSPAKVPLAVGNVPVPTSPPIVGAEVATNALPNSDMMSSTRVKLSSVTVPVFSTTNVKVTSKLSPLGTAAPATLASPTSGINSGVGSSDVPLSPWSFGLLPFGSLPLSLLSVAGMMFPSGSTPFPLATTWLFNGPDVPPASRSTMTWN